MVTHNPFISEGTADRIKAIRRRLAATTQLLQDPETTIEILARNPGDSNKYSLKIAEDLDVIRIRVRTDRPADGLINQGPSESKGRGTFRCWEADAASIAREHRFVWGGQWCEITTVQPARNGVVDVEFDILIGKQ